MKRFAIVLFRRKGTCRLLFPVGNRIGGAACRWFDDRPSLFPLSPRMARGTRFVFLALLLFLGGCIRRESTADLTILNGPEIQSLDPHIISGQADMRVVLSLFEGLTRFGPENGDAIPGIAERWDISADGRIYTFHLRTNAAWSTGKPITADDFVFSWRRALDPKTGGDYAALLFYIKNGEELNTGKIADPDKLGVKALDAHTLRVELKNPTPFFLELCASQELAVVPRTEIEKYGDNWIRLRPFPCSGAYTLEFWRLNDRARVRRNPYYWDAANTELERVDFLPSDSANTALNIYATGHADVLWDKNLIPTELLDQLRQRSDAHAFDYLGTYFVRFNVTRKPFMDPRVRKALALAVDKERIVQRICRGGEKIASHMTPDGLKNYDPPEGLGYNPDGARQLLREAGYPNGRGFPRFQYLFNPSPLNQQIGVELQAMWRTELGIEMELRQSEWKVYLEDLSKLDYDVCRSSWIGDYTDPNTFLDMFMSNNGNNRTGWANPRYDALINEANAEPDAAGRAKLLARAETLLVRDEAPVVPLYFYVGLVLFDANKWEGIHLQGNLVDQHLVNFIKRKKSAVDRRSSAVAGSRFTGL